MRGKLVQGRIAARVKIHFAERTLTAAPRGKQTSCRSRMSPARAGAQLPAHTEHASAIG